MHGSPIMVNNWSIRVTCRGYTIFASYFLGAEVFLYSNGIICASLHSAMVLAKGDPGQDSG
jgi:hypothetical protein